MTNALSYELPKNIKVFSVDPGDVHTDMNSDGAQDSIQTANQILSISENWKEDNNGAFLHYTGEKYPN